MLSDFPAELVKGNEEVYIGWWVKKCRADPSNCYSKSLLCVA